MALILKDYGYEDNSDEQPDARSFLLDLEFSVRESGMAFPWAVIFFPKEYPLGGHLLSIRPNRDIRFFSYSLMNRQRFESFDPDVNGAPPMSIVYVYSKLALAHPQVANSPIMKEACEALADKTDTGNWAVIVDPITPSWVQEAAETNEALYRKFTRDPALART